VIDWLLSFVPKSPVDIAWFVVGLVGQVLFASRWLVQLLASERTGKSTVPASFWWLSIVGGLLVLAFGLHDRNAVIVIGQWGVLVYLRNLALLRREQRRAAA
jgi:lipid-A-disaccharide synthase-like uncharacterized protein